MPNYRRCYKDFFGLQSVSGEMLYNWFVDIALSLLDLHSYRKWWCVGQALDLAFLSAEILRVANLLIEVGRVAFECGDVGDGAVGGCFHGIEVTTGE